jgi:hypothetical protein
MPTKMTYEDLPPDMLKRHNLTHDGKKSWTFSK